ncbi:MAG: tetratricopeptide repeat protein [Verrucomicrobia bacterium]|nr:tetratricopeptide repeat protein [Verrucomicrobiota bacterium]
MSSATAPNPELEERLSIAHAALQKGDLPKAASLYRSVLSLDPANLLANYWLGVLALNAGSIRQAVTCLQTAALADPHFPDVHLDLGLAHQASSHLDQAEACFRMVRERFPDYAINQLRLAADFEQQAQLNEAIEACRRALLAFPREAGLLRKLADLLSRLNRWPEALPVWRTLLEIRPDCAVTHYAFGLACLQRGDLEIALEAFQKTLRVDSTFLAALLNLGLLWQRLGKPHNAVDCFERALAINANDAEVHKALGDAWRELGQWTAANESWRKAIALRPDYADAWQNLALSLEREERLREALDCHQRVVELRPDDATARRYLGMVCQDLGMLDRAEESYRTGLTVSPNDADTHWQLFSLLASKGEFPEAWHEHEWRWEKKNRSTPKREFAQPRWNGEDLTGRAILLYGEQGFGDSIQAVRYAPLVQARGGRALVWCPPELVSIFQTVPGVAEVFSALGPGMKFDTHLPLMSLPLIFGTTLATIPNEAPYLRAPRDQLVKHKLPANQARGDCLKVGLVWCGSRSQPNDRRPVPFNFMRPLLEMTGIEFYSLQTGSAAEDAQNVVDLSSHLTDFAATAAVIEQLDLVITIDTSVAHLAGALGKPVWTLLSFASDWRWLLGREDSPWYPTMRLFRQTEPRAWAPVIERVCAALAKVQSSRTSSNVESSPSRVERSRFAEALVHHQSGRWAEAEVLYNRILQANDKNAEVLCLLGALRRQQGKLHEACEYLEKALALQPGSAQAHHELGLVCSELGELTKAIASYQRAIELQPEFPDAHYNLANAFHASGNNLEAMACYQRAVEQQPDFALAHYNLGLLAQERSEVEVAITSYRKVLTVEPTHRDALLNLALAIKDSGREAEAEANLKKLLQLEPDHAQAKINLASLLASRNELDQAESLCREVLNIQPHLPEGWLNLGVILQAKRDVTGAIDCFQRALKRRPDYADARFNLSIAELLSGRFGEGWRDFEARWQTANPIFAPREFASPLWQGETLAERTLLVHAEQGLGDAIQFIRYVPLLASQGARVIVECPPPLTRLLGTINGVSAVMPRGGALPSFDFHIPLLSLPLRFATKAETIPNAVPYLRVPSGVQVPVPAPTPGSLKIGLVWAGNPTHGADRNRSIPLALFEPIFSLEKSNLHSLQVGPASRHLFEIVRSSRITDLAPQLNDFAATAAAIEKMDLIISVDTAVAHLAGALAKPIWLLLPFVPDWRWLLDRSDSPWYPTMRLFRQRRHGDWASVIENVASALRKQTNG